MSSAKGRIRLLLEVVLGPGKPARPARFSGRPLRDSLLASDKDRSTYQAEWGNLGSGSKLRSKTLGPACRPAIRGDRGEIPRYILQPLPRVSMPASK